MKHNNIWTVIKKELARFFGDRRMLISVFLPGILIYFLYSVMGDTMMSSFTPDEDTVYTVQAEHLPKSIETLFEKAELPLTYKSDVTDPKAAVADQALDLYLVFPPYFEEDMLNGKIPKVEVYYNSASTNSATAYNMVDEILDVYESALSNLFDVNLDPNTQYDLASDEDMTGMIMSMMMPMLLMMLMFSGCMAVASESIAGEKERGTIATLLVTPMRRGHLAIGKIAALSIISLLSGLCSFFGVLLSMPKLMGGEDMGVNTNIYRIADYAWILGIILSTVLLFVAMISVISTLASSVKEAAGMVSPLMILVTVIGVSGMFGGSMSWWKALIPVYNSVQCISGIFSLTYEPMQVLTAIGVNCLAAGLLTWLLTRLFNSERVMFKK